MYSLPHKVIALSGILTISIIFQIRCIAQTSSPGNRPTDTSRLLEEVVFTGQYKPQSLKQSVYKVRVINQERIKMRGATDIAGVLNNEVGIRFSTDNTLGETDVNIMGMSGQNVKILLDGVPLVDRGSTKQSLSQIDINSIDRIEIVEGPMSVVYGTDALAGVINIITKKNKAGNDNLTITARIQEEGTGEYYTPFSSDGQHYENIGINWQQGRWNASGSFTRNNFGGWTGNAAYRAQEAKPKEQNLIGATLGFRHKNTNTWYRMDYLNEDIYVAGSLNTNSYRAKDQHYKTKRFTHQLQNEWQMTDHFRLSTALSYQNYERNTETHTIDYVSGTKTPSTDPGEQDVSTFKTLFVRTTGQWLISEKLSLQPGLELKTDRTAGERITGSPSITDFSVFASAEIKPVKGLNIRPGARFSKNSVYDAPPVIPSLNTKIALHEKSDLRLSYAHGFRAPILRELYFYFFDANHSIQGNTSLKAESSNSYNASVTRQFISTETLQFSSALSGFYNRFRNRIALASTSNNVFTYINIEKFRTVGSTLENNLSWKNLSATLGVSYIGRYNLYSEDKTFQQENLPKFVWSPEVSSNIIFKFPKLRAEAGIFYKFTGRLPSYTIAFNQSGQTDVYLMHLDSYHWADISLSKNLFKFFIIQTGIKNLFDVVRLDNKNAEAGSIHTNGGPLLTAYGRSFFIGLNFQWSRNK
ncbi:MAG: TonB-dependent receptor [Chitinophagaceae bacterium]|nr:TonB-dependent receptor [Chitinophagaceae bacterium]